MEWILEFYDKQNLWSGIHKEEVSDGHREKAQLIEEFAGSGTKRILELGAGGGQNAAAMADLGHTVVAIELVPRNAEQARKLAESDAERKITVLNDDFYTVALNGQFDVVCYWDGFGIWSCGVSDRPRVELYADRSHRIES